jgi:hypothetical protein
MVTSFSGGGSRSTRREPSTMGKQLVNFYHLQLRVECIQKVKEKKKKIIIKVENVGPNKIVVCTEMMMYYT